MNNAAFQVHTAGFEDLTDEQLDHTVKTNRYGYFYMAQACVEHVEAGAAIVNPDRLPGSLATKGLIDYSMTKGILAFTRSLASNLVDRGIRVNAVAPGPVWTPLNPSDKDAEKVADSGTRTPMKRPAQPEEIAPACVFLASSQCSSFITGESYPL